MSVNIASVAAHGSSDYLESTLTMACKLERASKSSVYAKALVITRTATCKYLRKKCEYENMKNNSLLFLEPCTPIPLHNGHECESMHR